MSRTLSKSDFKTAQECGTKLYYKELHYPTTNDNNQYLRMLQEGGYMVEAIARALFPEGRALPYTSGTEDSVTATHAALATNQATLFEATLLSKGKLARVDILKKNGATFDLIEVKAKSHSSVEATERAAKGQPNPFHGTRGGIASNWRRYLEDVTFQVVVLRELYPDAVIHPYLALVNKDKTVSEDLLHQRFHLTRTQLPGQVIPSIAVDFTGDVTRIRNDHFIDIINVADEVEELLSAVTHAAAMYVATLEPELQKITTPISVSCRDCEYRVESGTAQNGFRECWGHLADVEPNLLDLYHVSSTGAAKGLADRLIRDKQCSLLDIPTAQLTRKNGEVGTRNKRQLIQIECARTGNEWMSATLAARIQAVSYPLHFIDFETSRLVLPYHAGMRPYQTVAFQWSCHTVAAPGDAPTHAEWINARDFFPNVEFARTLRDCIGTSGTVLMWAHHERSVLREINLQTVPDDRVDPALAAWITDLAGTDPESPGRLVDMNALAVEGYFHPDMKGQTSIKVVLPAIWNASPAARRVFPEYELHSDGVLLDPYDALPPAVIAGQPVVVAEGTGAMLAYQEMLYGISRDDPVARQGYADLLRQYCRLDTAAMFIIWQHWCRLAAERPIST